MKQLTILASNKNKNPPVPQKIQELQELLQDFTGFTGFYRNYRIYRSLQELQECGMPALISVRKNIFSMDKKDIST